MAPLPWRRELAYVIEKAMAAPGPPIAAFEEAFGKGAKADAIEKKLAEFDAATKLTDEKLRVENLDAPLARLKMLDDPYVRLALALSPELARARAERKEIAGALLRVRPSYLAALRAFRASEGRLTYPDANSTLRVSFAEVKGYSPKEALVATPQTSTAGLLEKETGVEPFASPARVLDALHARKLGRWENARLGGVPIGFLSNADTTGGNSGSPAVNGKGELVGLNFDRVWENVAGDFGWTAERSRNVMVDVRYALWLIGDVDGQTALVDELLGK
jgi:hypothetical protein